MPTENEQGPPLLASDPVADRVGLEAAAPSQRAFVITALLLVNGLFLASMLALSKQAQSAGLSAIAFGFWMTLGAAILLWFVVLVRHRSRPTAAVARYWLVSGFLTVAAPQLLIFIAVGRIGAGLAAVAFALPTLTTWVMARWLGFEGRSLVRLCGAVLGATGAAWLLLPSAGALPPGSAPWMALALIAPFVIAAGNIYRRFAWPAGSRPIELAAGMLSSASAMFLVAGLLVDTELAFWTIEGATGIVLIQMIFAAIQFHAYFALQKLAHPVVFSLMGQIALLFAMIIGLLFLGETYSPAALGAVGFMVTGLLLVLFGKPAAPARKLA